MTRPYGPDADAPAPLVDDTADDHDPRPAQRVRRVGFVQRHRNALAVAISFPPVLLAAMAGKMPWVTHHVHLPGRFATSGAADSPIVYAGAVVAGAVISVFLIALHLTPKFLPQDD